MIVVDASLVVALTLREDNVTDSVSVYDLLRTTQLSVPAHWPAEIANALWSNKRRGRITEEMVRTAAEYIAVFRPRIEAAPSPDDIPALVQFAEHEQLTVYDALYVQLASLHGATLATIDREVRQCARRLDIPLLPA